MIGTGQDNEYLLGRGRLTWRGAERRSDRYGSISLMAGDGDSHKHSVEYAPIIIPPAIKGQRVKLMAQITETRESTHIGDLFRGIFPRTPNVGDLIVLGEGVIFSENLPAGDGAINPFQAVGVLPEDGRESDWMNPRSLYDCHEQTVDLIAQLSEGTVK